MDNTYKSLKREFQKDYKDDLIIFDIDGCIANSDDFVLTKKQAYDKELKQAIINNTEFKFDKPSKSEENDFDLEYFKRHHHEIQPYNGIFDLFVKMSIVAKVAIVTSRYEILKQYTIDWLHKNVVERHGEDTWRRMSYQMHFNEYKDKSFTFKKEKILKLMETYNILLLVEDHPQVVDWAKSKKIDVLVPATGYKNLNGKDIEETTNE